MFAGWCGCSGCEARMVQPHVTCGCHCGWLCLKHSHAFLHKHTSRTNACVWLNMRQELSHTKIEKKNRVVLHTPPNHWKNKQRYIIGFFSKLMITLFLWTRTAFASSGVSLPVRTNKQLTHGNSTRLSSCFHPSLDDKYSENLTKHSEILETSLVFQPRP